MTNKKKIAISIISLILILSIIVGVVLACVAYENRYTPIARPNNLSTFTKPDLGITEGDFYVSTKGNDGNDGTSKDKPFLTIKKAQKAVRAMLVNRLEKSKIVVSIMSGTYYENDITLNAEDSRNNCEVIYTAYGDGEVSISGGAVLDTAKFKPVEEEYKTRLDKKIADKVVCVDLSEYGVNASDYGELRATGFANVEEYYIDNYDPTPAGELFYNGQRMNLAKYPNNGYLKTGKIIDVSDAREPASQDYRDDWFDRRNQRGGTFKVDSKTNKRMKQWENLDDVWLYGYFGNDWSDSATPISSIDTNKQTVSTQYCSYYGYKKNHSYYIYNVFEELDQEGEYYIDRTTNKLFMYRNSDFNTSKITLSLTVNNIFNFEEGADNIKLRGLTIGETRSNGINIKSKNTAIEYCNIQNTANNGIVVEGKNTVILGSEITHVGKSGVVLNGGNIETQEKGNNIVENCLIDSFSELQKTYTPGISLDGVGNIIRKNEISNAPHSGIIYYGNDHIIEYNNIHDVVKNSSDAGAIYTGLSYATYGNIIRYNAIYNIGEGEFKPSGIYFDDNSSGQQAYGNLLINIAGRGFLVGGGRDNIITDNLVINTRTSLTYDARAYDGYHNNGWYKSKVLTNDGATWKKYEEAKRLNGLWNMKYDGITRMHQDYNNVLDPNFALNPAGSVIENNIFLSKRGYEVDKIVYQYSSIKNNNVSKVKDIGFVDYANGNYTLQNQGNFAVIPFGKIGRY